MSWEKIRMKSMLQFQKCMERQICFVTQKNVVGLEV